MRKLIIFAFCLIANGLAAFKCPKFFLRVGIECYRIADKRLTRDEARDHCRNWGGYLAQPNTGNFGAVIDHILQKTKEKDVSMWIDISDEKKEGDWVTPLGYRYPFEIPFLEAHWGKGEAFRNNRVENCAVIYITGRKVHGLADVRCSSASKGRPLCETSPL